MSRLALLKDAWSDRDDRDEPCGLLEADQAAADTELAWAAYDRLLDHTPATAVMGATITPDAAHRALHGTWVRQ